MKKQLFSIVVPMYNEQDVIHELYIRLKSILNNIDNDIGVNHEIIFVNDGSTDNTEKIAREICLNDAAVKLINFAGNFGHQIAVTAGLDYAKGDAIIIMDADLQDPPELITQMIEKYNQGYHVVYAVRKRRKGETIFKKITAKLFYRLLSLMTNIEIPLDTGDFRLISKEVCCILKIMKEKNRFIRGLVSWIGFKQTGIDYIRNERLAGKTKYSISKMIKLSLDGIVSFSTKPLKLSTFLGFGMSFFAFLYIVYAIIIKFAFNKSEPGWTSLTVLILLIGGVQMIMLGIVGEYISRIYDESKNRPLYIIKDDINIEHIEKRCYSRCSE